jgi:hypothetical protein
VAEGAGGALRTLQVTAHARERVAVNALHLSVVSFSRDRTERIAGNAEQGGVSPEKIQFIKNQLTELLTHYGEILYLEAHPHKGQVY